jgi:hypothetical protein
MALDWISRVLDSNSISSRLVITLFFTICLAQAIFIAWKWMSREAKNNNKESQQVSRQSRNPTIPVTHQKSAKNTNNSRNNNNAPMPPWEKSRWDAVAVFTGLLVFVTAIQVLAFVQSERASVTIGGFRFWRGLNANEPLVFFYDVRNTGKSTAFITDLKINWQVFAGRGSPSRIFWVRLQI